jgi:long-chain fatty acid transport protein
MGGIMINTHKIYRSLIIGSLFSCVVPGMAQAAGFALIEQSASGQGNAYAGAAAHVTDASTIFFNPAGMMRLEGDSISIAGHFIMPESSFTNNGSTISSALPSPPFAPFLTGPDDDGGANAFVPNFYWVKTIDEQMKFGLGMQTSFGLATKYEADWVGRYHAVETELKSVNFNPSIAYQVNDRLSIGGGLDIVLADAILSSAIDFGTLSGVPANSQNLDGSGDLEGDNFSDPGFGFNFGLQYMVAPETVFGVSFRSEIDIDISGDADFTVNPALGPNPFAPAFEDTGLSVGVTLPASLALSIAHQADKITYLADITWTGWSSFDELRIEYDNPFQPDSVTTEDWDDTFRYSIGFDYQYSDKMVLRSGLAYDETPIPSPELRTPRIPDNDRTWLSFGLTYILNDQSSIDVGYSHLFIDDMEINNTLEIAPPAGAALNATLKGTYSASVDILSVQWNKKF